MKINPEYKELLNKLSAALQDYKGYVDSAGEVDKVRYDRLENAFEQANKAVEEFDKNLRLEE